MVDADVQIDVELNFNTITGSNPVLTTKKLTNYICRIRKTNVYLSNQ